MKKQSIHIPTLVFIFLIPSIVVLTWWGLSQMNLRKAQKNKIKLNLVELPNVTTTNRFLVNKSPIQSPVLIVKNDKNEKEVAMKNLSIQTNIQNNIATTRLEMEFYNSENRDLEAELNFPLGAGQTISYFAMDVNGKMREGVAVEKVKARIAFETTIRKGIDPGLVEMTKGNNFKARVFPVPAKGYKKIVLEYLQELPSNNKKSLYFLPLNFKDKLSKFNLSVIVHQQELPPKTVATNSNDLKFREINQQFNAKLSKYDFIANKSIAIEIPANTNKTSVGTTKNGTYFHTTIQVPKQYKSKENPKTITVFWDVSSSRLKSNLKNEKALLMSYVKELKNVKVELIPFANKEFNPQEFNITNGDVSQLKEALNAFIYDGGTILESLKFAQCKGDEILLFSDGLPNLGKRNFNPIKKRIYTILSSTVADATLLNFIAEETNAAFINLSLENQQQALNKIGKDQLRFLGFSKNKTLQEYYPQKGFSVNGTIGISGKINKKQTNLTALFGYGNTPVYFKEVNCLGLKTKENQAQKIEKLMIVKKINFLENNYKKHKKLITDLGIKYKLVTKNTSLLVLDRLEDYLEHRIVPPLEMQKEYFKQLKEIEKNESKTKDNHLSNVKSLFKSQLAWYNKDFKENKPKKNVARAIENSTTSISTPGINTINEPIERIQETNSHEEQQNINHIRENPTTIRGGTWKDLGEYESSELPTVSANSTELVANGTTSNGFTSSNTSSNLSSTSINFNYSITNSNASTSVARSNDSNHSRGKINVKGWDPKSPYMEKIKKAKNLDEAYLVYLEEKVIYGSQPSFFLDVSDYFMLKNEPSKALRILTNIAELELENHSLLRMLANKLMQLKEYSTAIQLFKDLIELRPDEPQSYRDLGLAYAEIGNDNEAIKQLYKVVKEPYESRFLGIELIAMNEINALLFKNKENLKFNFIDKQLIKKMPVDIRVVLNWDADNTDVDLWVTGPDGEKCFYSNKLTRAGGRISNDFTQGYGPEEFMIRKAKPGLYKIEAHYYGSSSQSVLGKATLSVQFFKNYGTPQQKREEITRRLNATNEVIYLGTFKF
jgi:tetratricopeptide (TPR) repeat protein